MKKDKNRSGHSKTRYRVDIQVFILIAVIVVVACGGTFIVSYRLAYDGMINGLSERANNIHGYVEEKLGKESFTSLNHKSDANTAIYKEAKDILERVRNAAGVRYLYTAKQEPDGDYIYLVDGLDDTDSDFRYIGDLIEKECIPDIQKALKGQVVLPRVINHASWGDIFIAYFPIHDGDKVIGVLGIEFDAARQYETFRKMSLAAPVIILLSCLIAAVIAVLLFRRISNPAYKDMANTDLLTGLKNRNAFEVDLHNLEFIKEKQETVIVSVDLNDLKHINDTFGHSVGDKYIRQGSQALIDCIPPGALLYRIGGDEFAILLYGGRNDELEKMMQKLQQWSGKSMGIPEEVSMSVGYACYNPDKDQNLEDTFRRADENMYTQKKESKRGKDVTVRTHRV